jgi:CheY-like chemotaxis protein
MRVDLVRFFQEAKRRNVWTVLAVYVALALGLLTTAEYLFPALLLPEVANRVLAVLLLFGLPVVVLLAWAYDITSLGVTRTEPLDGPDAPPAPRGLPAARAARTHLSARPAARREPPRSPEPAVSVPAAPLDPSRVRRASIAQIRHDLRTPINAIVGYAEIQLEDGDWAGREELRLELTGLRTESEQLLSRIDAGLLGADGVPVVSTQPALPADLLESVTKLAERARTLADRAAESGYHDSVPDLERIAAAATHLRALVEQLTSQTPDAAARQLEHASAVARDVLSSIQPVRSLDMDVHEGSLLVVDDNPMNRDLLGRQLARQGYSVVSVSSGPEAFARLAAQEFDLILLDVLMPGMNGFEVLRRVKANDAWAEIPIIILSSLDELDSVVRCIEAGADDYLARPFDPVLLAARIRSNLRVRQVRRLERAYAEQLAAAQSLNERLLASFAPASLAEHLAEGDAAAELLPETTAIHAEVDGLPHPSSAATAELYLARLNTLFSAFDASAQRLGVALARSDGRAFQALAAPGADQQSDAQVMGELALELIAETTRRAQEWTDVPQIRIGIHIGSALLGVQSEPRIRVHLSGDALDVARQLATLAEPNTAHLSTAAFLRLRDHFHCTSRGVTALGPDVHMRTFVLGPSTTSMQRA